MMWLPTLILPEAFTVRSTSITSPDAGGNGRRPGGTGAGSREVCQVAGIQPGRQGLDPVAGCVPLPGCRLSAAENAYS
jgi:hypothetical protein